MLENKKILVIDDDPLNQTAVKRILKKVDGPDGAYATTGSEALTLLRQDTFDLVICDLLLPDIDGLGIVKEARLKGANQATPFIICSAAIRPELENSEDLANMNAVFAYKPIKLEMLEEALLKLQST